jgi:hypothetical protein
MSSLSLPPGYSPASTIVTDSDHGGWVTITNGVMLCNVMFFLGIRVYIRCSVSPPFRRDDFVLFLATVYSMNLFFVDSSSPQTGLVLGSVSACFP